MNALMSFIISEHTPLLSIQSGLIEAGFEVLELLADLEDAPLQEETERILFVVRKSSN